MKKLPVVALLLALVLLPSITLAQTSQPSPDVLTRVIDSVSQFFGSLNNLFSVSSGVPPRSLTSSLADFLVTDPVTGTQSCNNGRTVASNCSLFPCATPPAVPTDPLTLTVTSPISGDSLTIDSQKTITWQTSVAPGDYADRTIYLISPSSGQTVATVATNQTTGWQEPNKFNWKVGDNSLNATANVIPGGYRLRVTYERPADPSLPSVLTDDSDTFAVVTVPTEPPFLRVTSPNGGETLSYDQPWKYTFDTNLPYDAYNHHASYLINPLCDGSNLDHTFGQQPILVDSFFGPGPGPDGSASREWELQHQVSRPDWLRILSDVYHSPTSMFCNTNGFSVPFSSGYYKIGIYYGQLTEQGRRHGGLPEVVTDISDESFYFQLP